MTKQASNNSGSRTANKLRLLVPSGRSTASYLKSQVPSMRPHRLLLILLLMYGGTSYSAVLPDSERDQLVSAVMKNFWGHAKQPNGQFIQPSSEAERNTAPVSKAIVGWALDAGEVSGLGEWCKLDWEPNYFALTKAARSKDMSATQVAFVSFLHGAAQGRVSSAMSKSSSCNSRERSQVQQMLEKSKVRGLDGI